MKWTVKTFLILFFAVAKISGAQSSVPLPEILPLVQQTIVQQRFAETKGQDYIFREDTNDIRLRKECTWAPQCPGIPTQKRPVGVAFHVLHASGRNFEIFWLDGVRVARILPSCDGCATGSGPVEAYITYVPVSDTALIAENQRVDREVIEAKALLAQGKDASSPDDPPQIVFSRMLELCTFSNPRRETVAGRPTILLDFAWNSSVTPATANQAILKSFAGTIGIDEEDHAVQHVEGRFLADVKLKSGQIDIRKGTRVTITNRKVDIGIWPLARIDARGQGRYFAFSIDGDGHIFTGTYRKFHATSRMVSDSTEVSLSPPALPAPARVEDQQPSPETQARGYWIDPSSGLMWAGKDNGKNVNWQKATTYCRDLHFAGYSDWRLATIDELQGIFDRDARAPGKNPRSRWHGAEPMEFHGKGGLFLTGLEWSSTRQFDDRGKPSGYGWYFIFDSRGVRFKDELGFDNRRRALCVRGPGNK